MSSFYRDPLHRQIEAILRERVSTVYPPGGRIPTEVELAREFKVSLQTIRRALGDLTREGVIVRRRGSGTFAGSAPVRGCLALVCGVGLAARRRPYPELRLMEACQQRLESAGAQWRLYLGEDAARRFLREEERFSGVITLAFSEPPIPGAIGAVTRDGQRGGIRVAASGGAFLRLATERLRRAGCSELALADGGSSAWIEKETEISLREFLPWGPESAGWLRARGEKGEGVGLVIADPGRVEEILADLPGDHRIEVVAAGFAGEARPIAPRGVCYLDCDLEELASALVEIALLPVGSRPPGGQRVDAWHWGSEGQGL